VLPDRSRRLRVTHRRGLRPAHASESGAALILALAFMIGILVTTTALLGFATTSSRALRTYRQERAIRYAADSALESGIALLSHDTTRASCPTSGPPTNGPCQNETTDSCNLQIPVAEDPNQHTLVPGSFLTLKCLANPNANNQTSKSGAFDGDGSQNPRDVLFTVVCSPTPPAAVPTTPDSLLYKCGNGTDPDRIVARARVQYQIDFTYNCITASQCPSGKLASIRARVPQIIYWNSFP